MFCSFLSRLTIFLFLATISSASITGPIRVCAVRVNFLEDNAPSTTGNGQFLMQSQGIDCGTYQIDPPPHNRSYFMSQIKALNNYLMNVSYGKLWIDITASSVFPNGENNSYQLNHEMKYYNPYNQNDIQELRITELFKDALNAGYNVDQIAYSDYDVIIVFHAGIGQDFSLPFLDPTPEDIPSTYVDEKMILDNLNQSEIIIDGMSISEGIILPESQNHLLFDISTSMFSDANDPCEYQYGLTGTFALLFGFAIGLPPMWDMETGDSRIGVFGLMDQGSNSARGIIPTPPTAWSRIYAGWEEPIIVEVNANIRLPSRSENSIVKIPIRSDEYFLIENRNNSIKNGISIDSMRFLIAETNDDESYPSYTEILLDSSGLSKDTNGVILKADNYDTGLPGSGLLIWHVDETVIASKINNFGINNDINRMGVDLEEADGAQDIGHPSVFLFNDPSSGYFGDMWFRGNNQITLSNPSQLGMKPYFGPKTNPSTNTNDGIPTFLTVGEISIPKDTMSFSIFNTFIVNGYPDSSIYAQNIFDIDNDGDSDIIGGVDSIYVGLIDVPGMVRTYFHNLESENFIILCNRGNEKTKINVFEYIEGATKNSSYEFLIDSKIINSLGQTIIDSLCYPVYSSDSLSYDLMSADQWNSHTKRVYSKSYNFSLDIGQNGIAVDKFGETRKDWDENTFRDLIGIDLDMDTNVDVLALDSSGYLFAYDLNLKLMAGFPIYSELSPPLFSIDLINGPKPEIIARSIDKRTLYIFDHQGKEQIKMVINPFENLIGLGTYDGKNALFTSSSIYQFNFLAENNGNSWKSKHGNSGRTRKVEITYQLDSEQKNILVRSYCYPNPIREGQGTLRVESIEANKVTVNIYNLAGYFIEKFQSSPIDQGNQISEWEWNTSDLESGVYFAQVNISSNEMMESSIIKIAIID